MNNFLSKIYFFIKYITPVFVIAGVIFYLSAQSGLGDMKNNMIEIFLRKGAHFIEYGLLSFFMWRLFYYGWRFSLVSSFWISLLLVTFYAGSDEGHQFFIEGRSGKNIDVVVDFLSAFIVLQLVTFFMSKQKKYLGWLILGLFLFGGVVGFLAWDTAVQSRDNVELLIQENIMINKKNENKEKKEVNQTEKEIVKIEKVSEQVILPKKILHKVSFITQSPFAKWDELHEEACEEASLIMLKYYSSGESLNKDIAEDEIQKLVKYQMEKYGNFYDTDVKTNKEIGEEYFELKGLRIIKDFKIIDLKRELADGNIILIPTAGRELKNPYFSGAGPLYHNLVITGYDDKKNVFITNDPGTRRGKNYKYNQQVLYDAIHDFPGDVNKILDGKKRAVVLRVNL